MIRVFLLTGLLLGGWGLLAAPSTADTFAQRCAAAGVLRCEGFDTDTPFAYCSATGWSTPNCLQSGSSDDNINAQRDTAVKTSGASSLRFTAPPQASADTSGTWWGDLGANFGPGDTLYVQFRWRADAPFINTNYGGDGFKTVIFHQFQRSCAPLEITTVKYESHGSFPQAYTDCGGRPLYTNSGAGGAQSNSGDYKEQGDYPCAYPSFTQCAYFQPNVWHTFYYVLTFGTWGTATSQLRAYVQFGDTAPMQQWLNIQNYAIFQDTGPGDRFNRVSLTPYNTNRPGGTVFPQAQVWYDEFIVSTQPIAAPSPETPPPPDCP